VWVRQADTVGMLNIDFNQTVEPPAAKAARLDGVEVAVRLHLHERIKGGVIERQLLELRAEASARHLRSLERHAAAQGRLKYVHPLWGGRAQVPHEVVVEVVLARREEGGGEGGGGGGGTLVVATVSTTTEPSLS
jgi:hypothetical protein